MIVYIEGVDGVGKTTVMKGIARELIRKKETSFVLTKEPGGPEALWNEWNQPDDLRPYFGEFYETGKLVRQLCVDHPKIPQLAKRALFRADSLCNWELVYTPAIASGKVAISDRGWLSDLVYGSVLLNTDAHTLYQFNTALTPSLPDVSYVICLTAAAAVREKRLSTNMTNHMDKLGPEVRSKLDIAYRNIIPQYLKPDHYRFVSTSDLSVEDVVKTCTAFIMDLIW